MNDTFKIGDLVYPIDNSRSYNLATKECGHLAGMYDTLAKQVKIVSEPFFLSIKSWSGKTEFVLVEYENGIHLIINRFTKEQKPINYSPDYSKWY